VLVLAYPITDIVPAYLCSANRSEALWREPAKSPKSNSVAGGRASAVEPWSCGRIADNRQ